jgi:hypothetical protein
MVRIMAALLVCGLFVSMVRTTAADSPDVCDFSQPLPPCPPGPFIVFMPTIRMEPYECSDDIDSPFPPCNFVAP